MRAVGIYLHGRQLSDHERSCTALPVHLCGLGTPPGSTLTQRGHGCSTLRNYMVRRRGPSLTQQRQGAASHRHLNLALRMAGHRHGHHVNLRLPRVPGSVERNCVARAT